MLKGIIRFGLTYKEQAMELDLTQTYTIDDVADLIASKDDDKSRQLRVTVGGIAYLSDEVGADNLDGVLFRFETLDAGNDYVGQAAACDQNWVLHIYKALQKNWPQPFSSYIDNF